MVTSINCSIFSNLKTGLTMKKIFIASLLTFFFAHSLMAASVLNAQYDKEAQQVAVQVAYCTDRMNKISPPAELQDGMCRETYPMSCDVTLVVHNEAKDPKRSDTCLTERLVYDTANIVKPGYFNFKANDGSMASVFVD